MKFFWANPRKALVLAWVTDAFIIILNVVSGVRHGNWPDPADVLLGAALVSASYATWLHIQNRKIL